MTKRSVFTREHPDQDLRNVDISELGIRPLLEFVDGPPVSRRNALGSLVGICAGLLTFGISDKASSTEINNNNLIATKALQDQISNYTDSLYRTGKLARDEHCSWVAEDLRTGNRILDINGDRPRQAASLIKVYLALAFFHEVARGQFTYGPKSISHMREMLFASSNSAANWFFEQLGGPARVQELLNNNYKDLLKNTTIVENIPAGGKTYLNKSSANDYSRFLRALWADQLPYSSEMRRFMALRRNSRLTHEALSVPDDTYIIGKVGRTARCLGEIGVLVPKDSQGADLPYSIVTIIEKEKRVREMEFDVWTFQRGRIIGEISSIVYEQMKNNAK